MAQHLVLVTVPGNTLSSDECNAEQVGFTLGEALKLRCFCLIVAESKVINEKVTYRDPKVNFSNRKVA